MWANGLLGRALAGYYAGSETNGVKDARGRLQRQPGLDAVGWAMSNPWPALTPTPDRKPGDRRGPHNALLQRRGGMNPGGPRGSLPPHARRKSRRREKRSRCLFLRARPRGRWLPLDWRPQLPYATLAWHDLLEREAMQPSGVPVADEFYGPTGAFRGTETCDVAGYL